MKIKIVALCHLLLLLIGLSANAQNNTLNFDGQNDYISCGNILPKSYTIEAWIYIDAVGANIVSGSSGSSHAFFVNSGILSAGHNGNWGQVQDNVILESNQWYHVAVSYDQATTTLKLYKNGNLVSQNNSVPVYSGDGTTFIGAYDANYFFKGNIDEVRIWSAAISQSQIQENMSSNTVFAPGLIKYFSFNQGTAGSANLSVNKLYDEVSQTLVGNLNGFALTGTSSNWITSTIICCVPVTPESDYVPKIYNMSIPVAGHNNETWGLVRNPNGGIYGEGRPYSDQDNTTGRIQIMGPISDLMTTIEGTIFRSAGGFTETIKFTISGYFWTPNNVWDAINASWERTRTDLTDLPVRGGYTVINGATYPTIQIGNDDTNWGKYLGVVIDKVYATNSVWGDALLHNWKVSRVTGNPGGTIYSSTMATKGASGVSNLQQATDAGNIIQTPRGHWESTGAIRAVSSGSTAWNLFSMPDAANSSGTNANWFIGRGDKYADRTMTFHIPKLSDYGGSGAVPSFKFAITGNDPLLTLDASKNVIVHGKLGLGTSNPSTRLEIDDDFGTAGGQGIKVRNKNAGGYSEVVFNNDISQTDGAFVFGYAGTGTAYANQAYFWNRRNAEILFGTYDKERLRITGNGNVGIGTATPNAKFEVYGNGSDINTSNQFTGDFIINAKNTTRSMTSGAQLEFVIPANTDGSNAWGQGRILTVAGNTSNWNATGKMMLGTRRYFNKGQGLNWYYGDDIVIDGVGNVGLGTISPAAKLQVYDGNVYISRMNHQYAPSIDLAIGDNDTGIDWINDGNISIKANGVELQSIYSDKILFSNSKIGIGTGTSILNDALTVNGNILTKGIKVNPESVPDYVFKSEYKLRPLSEVESFIKVNSHLPEVPSEAEVKKNGLELGEMSTTLLKKIEELTLYMIEIKKENESLKAEIRNIKNKINK